MLCEAIRINVDLNQQVGNGVTKRQHLERKEKQTGKKQIPDFEIPVAGEHLWNYFWDLSGRRSSGFGPSLILYSEIEAWIRVKKLIIRDFEIEILSEMDRVYLETCNKFKAD